MTTRAIKLGPFIIGNNNPIRVQSMLKIPLTTFDRALAQALELESAGCEIIRIAVPDKRTIPFLEPFVTGLKTPVVADIHFDYRLALAAVEKGVAGLRINPGNIGSVQRVRTVVDAAKAHHVPIRIGVNAGSLEKDLLQKHGGPSAAAMVESALRHVVILEKLGFEHIKISLKASSVRSTIDAYKLLANQVDYPLHLGITEAGPPGTGTIKSAVGLAILLHEGLGDTIRVSLTGPPLEEVKVGYEILKALELRQKGTNLISCPTCGRCQYDIMSLVHQVEQEIASCDEPLTIAVMGCEVNGPGEAREADIGIAGGKKHGLLFRKGTVIGKYRQHDLFSAFQHLFRDLSRKNQP